MEKKTTLITAVEKILENHVLMTPIKLNNKVVGFPPDCNINLLYIEENHVFCWKHVVIKTVRHEKKIYHCAELIADAEILNRRGAYRVYIGEPMILIAFSAQGAKSHQVIVKDISETGMAFLSSEEFTIGRTVRLRLSVKKGTVLQLSAQIIRIQNYENRTEQLYGCKFLEKNNLLIGYLMHLQQERQKQKLGL